MYGIIFNHLLTKLKQPNTNNEQKVDGNYIDKLTFHIKTLIAKAIIKDDKAMLATLCNSMYTDLSDFFSKTETTFRHVERAIKELDLTLCKKDIEYINSKKNSIITPITPEQSNVIREALPKLKDYGYVYELARNDSNACVDDLNDYYTHPQQITAKEQALMLALGLEPNDSSDNYRSACFDENVKRNPIIKMLYAYSGGYKKVQMSIPQVEYEAGMPEHFYGYSALSNNYFEAFNAYKPLVTLREVVAEAHYGSDFLDYAFTDYDLHKQKLTSSNSLAKTISNYLDNNANYMPNLIRNDDGNIVRSSTKHGFGAKHMLTMLNTDVKLTRVVVRRVDMLCSVLNANLDATLAKCSDEEIFGHLRHLFSRNKFPYMPEYGSSDNKLVTNCCLDMQLKGISSLVAALHERSSSKVTQDKILFWIANKLPIPAITYLVSDNKLPPQAILSILKNVDAMDNTSRYKYNSVHSITNIAKLIGTIDRVYPSLLVGNRNLHTLNAMIDVLEKRYETIGLYRATYTRTYYNNFDSLNSATNQNADMEFLNRKVL